MKPTPPGYEVETVTQRIGGHDYRLRILRDRQQFSDPGGRAQRAGVPPSSWPMFGVLWPAGLALAEEMSRLPLEGRRILEAGCGIGLASLVLRRRGADITASDYHPLAADFLAHNAALNGLPPIRFELADWNGPNPALARFDLIIGADVLYEPDHVALLADFVAAHGNVPARVLIADPGRRQRSQFAALMSARGYAFTERRTEMDASIRLLDFSR